ncbi:MAG TPA: serpin family protein [Candidatus Binataceae bacterium]|nr:serpin family protein [Candidatus Binataceae bacterium]
MARKYFDRSRITRRKFTAPALAVILAASIVHAAIAWADEARTSHTWASKVYAAEDDFGLRLLRTLTDGNGGNAIISPFSVSMALAMTYNGASGETKAAMAKTLGIAQFSDDDFNNANRSLIKEFNSLDPTVQLEIANALWVQSGYTFNPAFLDLSRDAYDAPVESLDFARTPGQAVSTINDWTSKKTHGKIPTILDRVDSLTRLVLTNAAYFKGQWKDRFYKEATKVKTFHLSGGESLQTPMMTEFGRFQYAENDAFQEIVLPYLNERFAMYVVLPRKLNGLPDFIRSLDEKHWHDWRNGLKDRAGTIVLPKFESSYGSQFNDALKKMGMAVAFGQNADFSQIHSPPELYISDVEHKTYVKVDEEGTEAAATAEVMDIGRGIASSFHEPPPFEMIVDHPFFFAIADQYTGVLLFAGVVTNPTK